MTLQYVGGDENSIPFEAAPSAINTALDLIRRRIRQAELPFGNEFNELLTVAYMETQTMGVSGACTTFPPADMMPPY